MPVLPSSTYRAPWLLRNGHVQTFAAALTGSAPAVSYDRERIETPDGDFLDLDWSRGGSARLVILSYGMESDAQAKYVRRSVHSLREAGFDVLVWNYRSCGGEPNRKAHFYHGGLTGDLRTVVRHARRTGYADLALLGFSLGGNLTLNYVGLRGPDAAHIRCAIAVSTPVDVADCAKALDGELAGLYVKQFLKAFRARIRRKMAARPGLVSDDGFDTIRTLEDYDARYTVKDFGLGTVENFYRFVSSRHLLHHIRVPTLILSAKDDPFMGPHCIPYDAAKENPALTIEVPAHGGHLGFLSRDGWLERRIVSAINSIASGLP